MTFSTKLSVALVFGGRSAEHEVSIQSATNIAKALDQDRFELSLIFISRKGTWHLASLEALLNEKTDFCQCPEIALLPTGSSCQLIDLTSNELLGKPDALFPILHGPYGEDGSIQGLAKLCDLACVGASTLGSAVGMDKDVMKRLLQQAKVEIAPFITLYQRELPAKPDHIIEQLGLPLFVKPANMGSSVGVTKINTPDQLEDAIYKAFEYDHKLILETGIVGREIEVSVIGNDDAKASIPGEIKPNTEIYSYESKYLTDDGADLCIPAELTEDQSNKIRETAIKTYQVLECSGLARVDVFLTDDDTVVVNEINTLPGFTNISMYPKLWEESGFTQQNIISLLIELALEKHQAAQSLNTYR